MPQYRAYILDEHGRLLGAVDFDCADDETAEERAEQLVVGRDGELWKLVASFEAGRLRPKGTSLP